MLFNTSPLNIIDYPADSNHYARNRAGYRFIFIHHTAGTRSEDWLSKTSSGERLCSVHRLIKRDGRIFKIVPDEYVAFTQGYGHMDGIHINLNMISLSIELEHIDPQDYPTPQLLSCARQIVEWQGAYGFMDKLYHSDVDARKPDCPHYFPRDVLDFMLKNELARYI